MCYICVYSLVLPLYICIMSNNFNYIQKPAVMYYILYIYYIIDHMFGCLMYIQLNLQP